MTSEAEILDLNEHEKRAKKFWIHFLTKGSEQECDESSDFKMELPAWFDEVKFKRGQKYFQKNTLAILNSNIYGVMALISDPIGVQILVATNRSSTPATARKRYVNTGFALFDWYNNDLKPGSKSWKSLEKVRRMHFLASQLGKEKKIKFIPQREVSITAFGFMGYAVIRPHIMGLPHVDRENCEAFIFFWAVICFMLGVKDEFNFCLNSYEVVCIICDLYRRYMLLPFCQIETSTFLQMSKAYLEGQKDYMRLFDYDTMIFLFKRATGLPGYQYDVDISRETLHRAIFTDSEAKKLQESFYLSDEKCKFMENFLFENDIRLLHIKRQGFKDEISDNTELSALHKILELQHPDELSMSVVPEKEWKMHLNDSEFHKLTFWQQIRVKIVTNGSKNCRKWWVKMLASVYLKLMLFKLNSARPTENLSQ